MRAVNSSLAPQPWLDRRKAIRFPAALPVILEIGSRRICAQLINLASAGGCLQADVTPLPHSDLLLRCGTITVGATVAWSRGNQFGLKFHTMLTDKQIAEQALRTEALASRRVRTSPHGPRGVSNA